MFGPHLEGIVDRRAGSVEGYAYTGLSNPETRKALVAYLKRPAP